MNSWISRASRIVAKRLALLVLALNWIVLSDTGWGQDPGRWVPAESPTDASLRGVCAVDADVAWMSGAAGTVLRTVDGGKTVEQLAVPDAAELDFRDVHAWDRDRACLMVAGQPARFYSTTDGGRNWRVAYEDKRPEVFFDAMSFWDERNGIAFSDPIEGRLVMVSTRDAGRTWEPITFATPPATLTGEHGYAASGTCLATVGDQTVLIGLGGTGLDGKTARVFRSLDRGQNWTGVNSALPGSESAGVFSIKMIDPQRGVLVGGDYQREDERGDNAAFTEDGGATWQPVETQLPHGYRSAVDGFQVGERFVVVTAGPNGCDYSWDSGKTWRSLSGEGYHAIDFTEPHDTGWAVGADGRIARWVSAAR